MISSMEELSLATKLKSLGEPSPFDGLTTIEQRRDRARMSIARLRDVTFTVRDGKTITLAQQFERVYGEAL